MCMRVEVVLWTEVDGMCVKIESIDPGSLSENEDRSD